MSMSSIIEVACGMIFVYILLSLVCSSLNEIFATVIKLRARTLKKGIERLLTDESMRREFFAHPLIKCLGSKETASGDVNPSYIPSRSFATALIDVVASKEQACDAKDPQGLRKAIDGLNGENADLKKALLTFLNSADDNLNELRKNVEGWFDDTMERVTGWYKKQSQWILLGLSTCLVCLINVDTLELTNHLWQNPALRQQIAMAAEQYVAETESETEAAKTEDIEEALNKFNARLGEVRELNIPIGWSKAGLPKGWQWLWKIVGLAFTILSVSLGAPFWFDLLNKVTRLRVSGEVPKKADTGKK